MNISTSRRNPDSESFIFIGYGVVIALFGASFLGSSFERQAVHQSSALSDFIRREVDDLFGKKHTETFAGGLSNWTMGSRSNGRDWSIHDSIARPGRLRLWRDSAQLEDYRFEFGGIIEQKAISWAFRAASVDDYYASKLAITRNGSTSRAELVRFAVIKGQKQPRVRTPLTFALQPNRLYRIGTVARGSQFTTYIDGRMADTWTDARIAKGGVGFFSEDGETASIVWATVSKDGTALQRLLSYITFMNPAHMPGD